MTPFIVLVVCFAAFFGLGRAGVRLFRDSVIALRWALCLMFLFTASAHFAGLRADLVRMVPPIFPHPEVLVTATGILEIAGAIGLLVPRRARYAAGGLAVLLLAMFPANVYAAQQGLTLGGAPVTALGLRSILQVVFLAAVVVAGFVSPRSTPEKPERA